MPAESRGLIDVMYNVNQCNLTLNDGYSRIAVQNPCFLRMVRTFRQRLQTVPGNLNESVLELH